MDKIIYDVIVVGAGVAGASAAMYAGRFNLKTLIVGEMPGGTITTTDLVENYPGIRSIGGAEMGQLFLDHAKDFNAELKMSKVERIEKRAAENAQEKSLFAVKTAKEEFIGKTVILATGTKWRKLGVPGEDEFSAKGVSYCALCDGAFYREKEVALVGGGDSAAIDANILTKFVKKVHVFVRKKQMRAEPVNYEKMLKSEKIQIHYETEVAEINGDEKVTGVTLKSGEKMDLDGVFVAIGHIPLSDLAKDLGVELDDHGYIPVDVQSRTSMEGVYACGDVTDKPFKQAIIGASEGVMATYSANEYLES